MTATKAGWVTIDERPIQAGDPSFHTELDRYMYRHHAALPVDTKGRFVTIDERVVFIGGLSQGGGGSSAGGAAAGSESDTEPEATKLVRNYYIDDEITRDWLKVVPRIRQIQEAAKADTKAGWITIDEQIVKG